MSLQKQEWKWFGCAGHFICSFDCRFHLFTLVGQYIVSTVGEFFPDAPVREILAEQRGVKLEGRGDARKNDYMQKIGFEPIGYYRKYETMVFKAGKPCTNKDCGCGATMPESGIELEMMSYNTAGEATKGHMELCKKWSKK